MDTPTRITFAMARVRAVDWLDQLREVKAPTLVIAGAQDVGATPEMAKQIADRIPGAELQVFEEAAHLSVAEVPEQFEAAVRRLLERV